MAGFFAGSTIALVKAPETRIPACGACQLFTQCRTPKMKVAGQGRKKILIVGECPSVDADKKGSHFVDDDLTLLKKVLKKHQVDLEKDCWSTHALICRTKHGKEPTDKQIEHCRPNIINTIEELKPVVVILLGTAALRSVVGWLWKDKPGALDRWAGFKIPDQEINTWICPTFSLKEVHGAKPKFAQLYSLFFERHIKNALTTFDRPWGKTTPIADRVRIELDTDKAAKFIRKRLDFDGDTAFDYETNAIKPDNPQHMIVSCAICYGGEETIAFPWQGKAIDATREYLRSPVAKRGCNIKFEERWTRSKLNTRVRNWVWDSMVAAHVEDCRRGICSVKFQSYVKLGIGSYNDHIEDFLRAKKDSSMNQILSEIDIHDLLKYNGIDAYVEYVIGGIQMKNLKYKKAKQ